jgi:hypothetical protein
LPSQSPPVSVSVQSRRFPPSAQAEGLVAEGKEAMKGTGKSLTEATGKLKTDATQTKEDAKKLDIDKTKQGVGQVREDVKGIKGRRERRSDQSVGQVAPHYSVPATEDPLIQQGPPAEHTGSDPTETGGTRSSGLGMGLKKIDCFEATI